MVTKAEAIEHVEDLAAVCERQAAEITSLKEGQDKLLRRVIDRAWGEAMMDQSVPSTKLQNKILAACGVAPTVETSNLLKP